MALLGTNRDQSMQFILMTGLTSYKDLIDPKFKKDCIEKYLEKYPDDSQSSAIAHFNQCYCYLGKFIPSEQIMLETISESQKEQEICNRVIERVEQALDEKLDDLDAIEGEVTESAVDSIKQALKGIAYNNDVLLKAVGVKSKVTANIMNAAGMLGKQQQGNEHISIAKIKNDILAQEGESIQDLIKLQMLRFADVEKELLAPSPANSIEPNFKVEVLENVDN